MTLDEKAKEQARDELRMLRGEAPHNTPSNLCYGDGYFAASLVNKYGMSIAELEKAILNDTLSANEVLTLANISRATLTRWQDATWAEKHDLAPFPAGVSLNGRAKQWDRIAVERWLENNAAKLGRHPAKSSASNDEVATVSKNFNDILAEGKVIFADGIIQGKPFAKIVTEILYLGERYGEAYALTEKFFFASTSLETYDEVQRFAVSYAFERLFKGNDIVDIVHSAAMAGAAWGFKQQQQR